MDPFYVVEILRVKRPLAPEEQCGPRAFSPGDIVYRYHGYTYQCISPEGVAITEKPDVLPFYELPANALEHVGVTESLEAPPRGRPN